MFRKNDIVICIDNSKLITGNGIKLKINEPYIIEDVENIKNLKILYVEGIIFGMHSNRFITLSEYRKRKINKIKDKIK